MTVMLSGLHFLTHIGLSWIVANLAPLSGKDRAFVVLAGVLPDLDGVTILWGRDAYLATHRIVAHSLLFGVFVVAMTVFFADSPRASGILAAVSIHVHLLLDVVGTGGPPIRYLWPVTDWGWTYGRHWVLASWPNAIVMGVTLAGVLVIAWRRRRPALTPAGADALTGNEGTED
jgi:membrane-bound metal-dependent hydrolase YbcI (DUF457 family)